MSNWPHLDGASGHDLFIIKTYRIEWLKQYTSDGYCLKLVSTK